MYLGTPVVLHWKFYCVFSTSGDTNPNIRHQPQHQTLTPTSDTNPQHQPSHTARQHIIRLSKQYKLESFIRTARFMDRPSLPSFLRDDSNSSPSQLMPPRAPYDRSLGRSCCSTDCICNQKQQHRCTPNANIPAYKQ